MSLDVAEQGEQQIPRTRGSGLSLFMPTMRPASNMSCTGLSLWYA
ncbi:MAG: hypothetical protein R3E31_07685 [Chloroflexota bacterium]